KVISDPKATAPTPGHQDHKVGDGTVTWNLDRGLPTRYISPADIRIEANYRGSQMNVGRRIVITLATLAAISAVLFIAPGFAAAEETALCKADESPCSAGNLISHVHE